MTLDTFLEYALPIALVVLAIAAIWLVVELALTMRRTRSTMETIETQLKPTLKNVDAATAALIPAVEKIDPLMERVNLSVDAVNLEIMRVDTVLENAGEITKNLAEASEAATAMANAPQNALNEVTATLRRLVSPRAASDESIALGERKEAEAKKKAKKIGTAEMVDAVRSAVAPVKDAVQDGRAQEAAEKKIGAAVNKINAAAQVAKDQAQVVKGQAQTVAAAAKGQAQTAAQTVKGQANAAAHTAKDRAQAVATTVREKAEESPLTIPHIGKKTDAGAANAENHVESRSSDYFTYAAPTADPAPAADPDPAPAAE